MKYTLLLTSLLMASATASACEPDINGIIQKTFGDNIELVECKANPAVDGQTIVAFAISSTPKKNDDDVQIDDLGIVLIEKGKITAKRIEKRVIQNDAIYLDQLNIDTGRYNLNNKTRAFGINLLFRNTSGASPYSETVLKLYTADKQKLHPVVKNLVVRQYSGENDGGRNCEGNSSDLTRYIIVSNQKHSGYYDLRLTGKTKNTQIHQCKEQTSTEKEKETILHYNGSFYDTPDELTSDSIMSE